MGFGVRDWISGFRRVPLKSLTKDSGHAVDLPGVEPSDELHHWLGFRVRGLGLGSLLTFC